MKWMVQRVEQFLAQNGVQRSLRCTPPQPGRETYLERRDGRNVPTHAPDPMRKVAVFERRAHRVRFVTEQQRKRLREFRRGMRTVATLFQNSLIGPQAKAVYATMVKMGPSLISESRSLADEVNTILEDRRFPSADA